MASTTLSTLQMLTCLLLTAVKNGTFDGETDAQRIIQQHG